MSRAKGQLNDLVRRAEAGEEIVITRRGHAVARLVPLRRTGETDARMDLIAAVQSAAATKRTPGPSAARSQDFLYGDDGLPK